MKTECEAIQSLLLTSEGTELDSTIREHIASCAQCGELAAGMVELSREISSQPVYRASDRVLGALAAKVEARVRTKRRISKLLLWISITLACGIAAIAAVEVWTKGALPILTLIESSGGAVGMIAFGISALLFTLKRRYLISGSLAAMALLTFVVRSQTQTFFNSSSFYDSKVPQWAITAPRSVAPMAPPEAEEQERYPSKSPAESKGVIESSESYDEIISAMREDLRKSDRVDSDLPVSSGGFKAKELSRSRTSELSNKVIERIRESDDGSALAPSVKSESVISGSSRAKDRLSVLQNSANAKENEMSRLLKKSLSDKEQGWNGADGFDGVAGDLEQNIPMQVSSAPSLKPSLETRVGGKGISGGSFGYGSIVTERMQGLVSHIQILSGREMTAVLSGGFEISNPSGSGAFMVPSQSLRVKLLAGVNASTDGTPYPVIFRVLGEIQGLPATTEARLVAAAQGSLADSRVLFRLTSLNLQIPDRSRSVVPVDGWIVGEDGLRGAAGSIIDPIGAAISGTRDSASPDGAPTLHVTPPSDPVSRLFDSQFGTDALEFKSPVGYWANTYIPGDPLLRGLAAKLGSRNREVLKRYTGRNLELERRSRPALQPLDIPAHAALGISLTGDIKAAAGPARMLLQLSIKGAERKSTLRKPLHVAIVLDPSAADPALIGAALNAFDRTKVDGDKFGLIVAGRGNGAEIPLGEYRFGTVQSLLEKLREASAETDPSFTPVNALRAGFKMLKDAESKSATFGSSTVVFLSGADLNAAFQDLRSVAYEAGLEGVPVNTIAVGADAPTAALGEIALAGQGKRLQLLDPGEAEAVVKEELAATGDVVARAVRLNIKLAPGTKLIDVLGSKSLDEAESNRVRQTEKSIDLHMERSFGITSDRGSDEHGIEIVIPAFYSGDAHIVLLDLLAQGQGAVAEVHVKYKDLIEHKNGEAQASFTLAAGEQASTERSAPVLKNLLSAKLAAAFQEAVDAVHARDDQRAIRVLSEHAAIIAGIGSRVPTLSNDPDLERDREMIEEYLAVLRSPAPKDADARVSLLLSLELAGKMKLSESEAESGSD